MGGWVGGSFQFIGPMRMELVEGFSCQVGSSCVWSGLDQCDTGSRLVSVSYAFRASLSGTFLQRKDVANQCLELCKLVSS